MSSIDISLTKFEDYLIEYELLFKKDLSESDWVIGGASATSSTNPSLNDLMFYSTRTNQWTWVAGDTVQKNSSSFGVLNVASPTNYPSSRSGAYPFKDLNGDLGFFGGIASDYYSCLSDMWIFTPDSNCTRCTNKLTAISIKTDSKNQLANPYLFQTLPMELLKFEIR